MTAQLEARGLALRAGTRALLHGLALRLEPGTLWCLLGPNGSGKSTLLHTLAGLRAPAQGKVLLRGRPIEAWSPGERACLRGLLPQALHDAFGAPVREIVHLGRHPHLGRWAWDGGDDDHRIVHAALAAVQMDAFVGRDVTTLSGGERQRVGIAALLAQDPLVLLLDEPVAHLDLHHQLAVLAHLRTLAERSGKAVLLSIHDLNLARRFATHAIVLAGDGGVPVVGPVEQAMAEATLSCAFGHRLRRAELDGRVVYLPE